MVQRQSNQRPNQRSNQRGQRSRRSNQRSNQQQQQRQEFDIQSWHPKTDLGKKVKEGSISDINEVVGSGKTVLEASIVDALVPNLENDLLMIGQAKGKFGGGQRRVFRQTQKKTKEGNKPSFSTFAVVGNGDGYVGIGYGKAKETVPAREKAVRNAKLGLIQIARGAGDWESSTKTQHTIPFTVSGKSGSVEITLMPAPLGTGLIIEPECAKILKMAGIKNIRSRTKGHTASKSNLIKACFDALKKLAKVKVRPGDVERLAIVYGALGAKKEDTAGEQDE